MIATGGGAAAYGDNLERMRAAGLVVALGVDVDEARARARPADPTRPLLAIAGDARRAARAPIYRRAHAVVETTGRTIAEVVADGRARSSARGSGCRSRTATRRSLALGDAQLSDRRRRRALDGELVRSVLGDAEQDRGDHRRNVARHWLAPALAALPRRRA